MLMDYRVDKNILYIALNTRIDVSNSNQIVEEINNIRNKYLNLDLVLDADRLEYISSAGLRVLLATQKSMSKRGKMIVKEVNDTVMEIFNITGFVDILTIE